MHFPQSSDGRVMKVVSLASLSLSISLSHSLSVYIYIYMSVCVRGGDLDLYVQVDNIKLYLSKRSFFQAAVASILLYGCTTNCTATSLLSGKLFKLYEPDMQDTAGEAGMSS